MLRIHRPNPRAVRVLAMAILVLHTAACSSGGTHVASDTTPSIARTWDEEILAAIRIDIPNPPVHARNLWHLSMAMYDAWAVYDSTASGYLTHEKIPGLGRQAAANARREAISYAAYRVLSNRYALSANADTSLAAFDSQMASLGFDAGEAGTDGNSPAAVGNRVAAAVIAFGNTDGSNQAGGYADPSYTPVNDPLIVAVPGDEMNDPNRWQPLSLQATITQNGIPLPVTVQKFLGPQWNSVTPFALTRSGAANAPYLDPGPPPRFGTATDGEFKQSALELIRRSSQLDPADGNTMDISPAALGNNPLGTNDGTGYATNPVTGETYPSQIVPVADFARVMAEFWADGPHSETPPGHWNVIANYVSDHPLQTFRFAGSGRALDRLEWDVKLYFALNAALHDAAVQCWGTKRVYDSVRPISMIRYMATLGQSTDPTDASTYDPGGLPLEDGLVERITPSTWPNGRHAGIQCCVNLLGLPAPCVDSNGVPGTPVSCVGEIAVRAWPGQPADPASEASGVRWIRAKEWMPYQRSTFVTPSFAGYTSGHSTFSRAAAEVLAAFTGSPYFPGGLYEVSAPANSFLGFEHGPSVDVTLQAASYFDASDLAGQSRLWGGIHIQADDFGGRRAGSTIGRQALAKAKMEFDGAPSP